MYFSHFTQPSRGLTTSVPGQKGTLIGKNSDTVKTFNHIISYVITLLSLLSFCECRYNSESHSLCFMVMCWLKYNTD